jgi:hypothetical protein
MAPGSRSILRAGCRRERGARGGVLTWRRPPRMPALHADPDHGARHDLPAGANARLELHPHRPGPPRWLAGGHPHQHVQVRADRTATQASTEACAGRSMDRKVSVVMSDRKTISS